MSSVKTVKVAIIGFGPAFNMGPAHINGITANDGFELAAVCDMAPERCAAAKEMYPEIQTFTDVDQMLATAQPGLTVVITPHYVHAEIALKCLHAGSHTVVEKPMCVTTDEVKALLAAAKQNKVVLSTYHNRRWDADFTVLRELIQSGVIGKVFRIDASRTGYRRQGTWWRSDKRISGGAIYDWGAHFTDWMLSLNPEGKVQWVSGFQVKNPAWDTYTNEDHSEYTLGFDNGCVASLTMSNLSAIECPRWTVRGDRGSIVDVGGKFRITTCDDEGNLWTREQGWEHIKWNPGQMYYENLCKFIQGEGDLVITPESAGRVICVLDSANQSAAKGGEQVTPWLV